MISLTTYGAIFSICVFIIIFTYAVYFEISKVKDMTVQEPDPFKQRLLDLAEHRQKVISENTPHYYPIEINQSSIYPDCEIKGIRYNMVCDGTGTGEIQFEDFYSFFSNVVRTDDIVYQSCGDKSENYCAVQNKNPLFCGEYNATREFIKDSMTCQYQYPCHIEHYDTGYKELILDYVDTHQYRKTVYGTHTPPICFHCVDNRPYGTYTCEPIELPVMYKDIELQEITNQTDQECGIKTAIHNVFYKDITSNLHPARDEVIQYNIIDYENTVHYNSCERDEYPPVDDRYCLINKGQDHFCGEYQAVKTWINQNPNECELRGDCFIQNRHVDYYEDLQVGRITDWTTVYSKCDSELNSLIINDNNIFNIHRELGNKTTLHISNITINTNNTEHHVTFGFDPIYYYDDDSYDIKHVQFKPRDGKYQFIESIDFFKQIVLRMPLQNHPIFVHYDDQCGVSEFYLEGDPRWVTSAHGYD